MWAFIPAVAWMGLIFYLSSRSKLPKPPGFSMDIVSIAGHFTFYGTLALLLFAGLWANRLPTNRAMAIAFAMAIMYGLSDELHQSFVPGRTPDPLDVLTDATGAATALAIWFWIRRLTGRAGSSGSRATTPTETT